MKKLFQIINDFFSFPILDSVYENEYRHRNDWEARNQHIASYWDRIGCYMRTVIRHEQEKGNIPY